MKFTVVIPARYGSSRLPGKPLADIAGRPMVEHVYNRACESKADRVVVATDDDRVAAACAAFGAEVVMTSEHHASGTDRLEEVARKLCFEPEDCVVNVQGDEPLIPPALINQVADNLYRFPDAGIATLSEPIVDPEMVFNPNVVKVVSDNRGMASYFSRAPIPWARDAWADLQGVPDRLPEGIEYHRHIGIYGYRAKLLHDFVHWSPAPTETTESLEQLRALFHGARIHVECACETPPHGVDTQEDLDRVRAVFFEASH